MDSCFHILVNSKAPNPEILNNPFFYKPSPLGVEAFDFVANALLKRADIQQFFEASPIGKMIGILLVENSEKQLGVLVAFSGKLGEKTYVEGFVPPIFNTLDHSGFYKAGEAELDALSEQILALENDPDYLENKNLLVQVKLEHQSEIEKLKNEYNTSKQERAILRKEADEATKTELDRQSANQQYEIKARKKQFNQEENALESIVNEHFQKIELLKKQRKNRSQKLQEQLFDSYHFLNRKRESQSLLQIFRAYGISIPPSGAGECAAPKLFQYAFSNGYKSIELLEFWWGKSPSTRIRRQGNFYPSCRSKCEPILGFMLNTLKVAPYYIPTADAQLDQLEILYEDDFMAALNKPHDVLSVPGKGEHSSVESRLPELFPDADYPKLVHRLDRGTSGVLLVAKTELSFKKLQRLFEDRAIQKKYVAKLNGIPETRTGVIKLPLRVDLDNRPQQMVCFEHGLEAETRFEISETKENECTVFFFPRTGRTHQLRVHAAHKDGLNCPIVGDDLYGSPKDRMYLHAFSVTFIHPFTKKRLTIHAPLPW